MTSLANEIDNLQARSVLLDQAAFLEEKARKILQRAEEKKKKSRGIFSFIFNIFG